MKRPAAAQVFFLFGKVMKLIINKHDIKISIRRPDYKSQTAKYQEIFSFNSNKDDIKSPKKIKSLTFTETLYSPEGRFSLELFHTVFGGELENSAGVNKNKNILLFEVIKPRDFVFIYINNKLKFIGVIENSLYASSISGNTIGISYTLSGYGIGGLISRFAFILDIGLYPDLLKKGQYADAEAAQDELLTALNISLSQGDSLENGVKMIMNAFFKLAQRVTSLKYGLPYIIESLYKVEVSSELKAKFPLTTNFISYNENNLWQILSGIFPVPTYEIFGHIDESDEKFKFIMRETPFNPSDWAALKLHKIDPVLLTSFTLERSDQEVYTYYLASISGNGYTRNEQVFVSGSVIDEEKWPIYGHIPLMSENKFVAADRMPSTKENPKQINERITKELYEQYRHNDEMVKGRFTLKYIEDEKKGFTIPRIGEKIAIFDCEFYVTEVTVILSHSESTSVTLGVNRGAIYSKNGQYKSAPQNLSTKIYDFISAANNFSSGGINGYV
jgi:hypothetical protein